MRMMVSVPMNYFLKCEVIYGTSKTDMYKESVEMSKVLATDIVNIQAPYIRDALIKIIDKVKNSFPIPTTYRLWNNKNFYVEETIIEL
jgi:hypothetical protein